LICASQLLNKTGQYTPARYSVRHTPDLHQRLRGPPLKPKPQKCQRVPPACRHPRQGAAKDAKAEAAAVGERTKGEGPGALSAIKHATVGWHAGVGGPGLPCCLAFAGRGEAPPGCIACMYCPFVLGRRPRLFHSWFFIFCDPRPCLSITARRRPAFVRQVDPVLGAAHTVSDRAAQAKDALLHKGACCISRRASAGGGAPRPCLAAGTHAPCARVAGAAPARGAMPDGVLTY
jgi:hypothetical protein